MLSCCCFFDDADSFHPALPFQAVVLSYAIFGRGDAHSGFDVGAAEDDAVVGQFAGNDRHGHEVLNDVVGDGDDDAGL